jgi:signal peptidase I
MENNISENVPLVKNKSKEFFKNVWDLVRFATVALAIVIPIRLWIAQPFVVSGESMFPTFNDKEYLIVDEISFILGKENRGDVVVFRYPGDTSRYFIKRIIGMPNETIVINDGKVTIINKENPDGFILNEPYIKEAFHTTGTYTTSEDEYFVMGDNRNRSSDSRIWGILPKKLMIGRAYLRLIPLEALSYLPGSLADFNK